VSRYYDQVVAALAGLPPAARQDLVEDLPDHLAEVAAEVSAEGAGSLRERLGAPEVYAQTGLLRGRVAGSRRRLQRRGLELSAVPGRRRPVPVRTGAAHRAAQPAGADPVVQFLRAQPVRNRQCFADGSQRGADRCHLTPRSDRKAHSDRYPDCQGHPDCQVNDALICSTVAP
jgi:hypothetical protein